MQKIRIGLLGTSNIAFRRFIPSVKQIPSFTYIGLAIAGTHEWNSMPASGPSESEYINEQKKADDFCRNYGGDIYNSYELLLRSDEIDAVYIPLPPALHYKWAKLALEYGKHVLLEKPFTTRLAHTQELVALAAEKRLALHENYAFCYHEQLQKIFEMLQDGTIGELRQIRAAFGFPFRGVQDFRYIKELGGGSLFDCGVYPIKISSKLLGISARVLAANLKSAMGFDVDIYGSATLQNDDGLTAQITFGMDNAYKCEVEIWGSKGILTAPRIYTAPDELSPQIIINNPEQSVINVSPDCQFKKSALRFLDSIQSDHLRAQAYEEITKQSELIDSVYRLGGMEI